MRPVRLLLLLSLAVLAGCRGQAEIIAAPVVVEAVEQDLFELVTPELLTSCATEGTVEDLEIVDDRMVFAGDFTAVLDGMGNRHEQGGLAACTLDGTFIDTFANPTNGLVRAVTRHEDLLLLGGNFTVQDQTSENFVAVDATSGEPVEFGPRQIMGSIHAISIADSGNIYLSGSFSRVDGVARSALVRLESSGALDSEFSPRITRTDDEDSARVIYAVTEDDGRVYIGGDFGTINGERVPGVGSVDTETGRITTGFSPDLVDTNPLDGRVQVRTILVQDDWVYLCGDWWTTEGRGDKDQQRNFGRFDRTGTADSTLEPWTDGGIRDCQFVGDSLISLGGHFDVVSDQRFRKLAVVSLETGEVSRVMGADSVQGVHAIDFNEGDLYIGGTFGKIQGTDQPGIGAIRAADRIAG